MAPAVLRLVPERAAAGALISAILRSLCRLLEIAFAVLFFTTGRAAAPAKSGAGALLRRVPALGFVSALAIGVVVIPTMERIRLHPESDPGGFLFRRYHAISTLFFAIAFLCSAFVLAGTVAAGAAPETAGPVSPKS
ncbi:MAG TPA: hypothetical protein VFS34_12505 [Thermoanaerobaculia bacterium]|nr:hypothetical protein [Thermoanaerobaculia bacterium]